MAVKNYDLNECTFAVDGRPVEGFADGDAVTVEFAEDRYIRTVGADGKVVRSASNNRVGSVTFNLQYTSPLNAIFTEILNSGRVVGIYIVDNIGGTEFDIPDAWPKQFPSTTFASEVGSEEWVFETGPIEAALEGTNDEIVT